MNKKTKTKNISIVLLLSISLLLAGNLQATSAQTSERYSNYDIHMAITPSAITSGSDDHQIGYIYFVNKNGVSIASPVDVDIILKSDDPSIASVPEKIFFPTNSEFAEFDIKSGQSGKTTITATLGDKSGFADIQIGADEKLLPDDLVLELNFPTNKMHVNSEMPFSVFLRTSDGTIIRAPYDIEVTLDFEKSLAIPNDDKLTIKEGDYYAWGTVTTNQKIGTAFIRALQAETQLDTAKSIEISSTLPAALNLYVYPYLVPAEIDRNLDLFVTVVDSNGDPTVANEDIPIKFFSNNQDFIGEELDDAMEETKMVIKKGEFGFNYRLNVDLVGLISNDLLIGVSSAGYGTAIDRFQTVGESISVEDQRIQGTGTLLSSARVISATDSKAVQLFGPLKIPSNATAVFAYQLGVEEDDEGDTDDLDSKERAAFKEIDIETFIENQEAEEDERREGVNTQDIGGEGDVESEGTSSSGSSSSSSGDDDVLIYSIDNLQEGNIYPLQANEDYRSTGLIQYLDVISEDSSLASVIDPGKIRPSYSYGTTVIQTTQKSGEFLISANIKGIGSGSFLTEVVNTLEQTQIKTFSPTGDDTILINRDGSFDVFLVALDSSDRPKTLEKNKRYLITPSNGIVDIPQLSTFSKINLQSESFSLEDGGEVTLNVESIAQEADVSLKSTKQFNTQLSSKVNVLFPLDNLDINKENHVGVVELVDVLGTPIKSVKDMRVKISSSDESVIQTNEDAVIKKGFSYAEFPMKTMDKLGESLISSSARGVIGGNSTINTSTSSSSLSIFTSGLIEPIPVNEEIQVKIFVDDDIADSVAGATVTITPNVNATTSTNVVRTGSDGSATFGLTAINGPEITVNFEASAAGYKDGSKKLGILVDTPPGGVQEIQLPQELVYVIIGGIVIVAIVVGLFLKKSKETIDEEEEPWEDEDI